MSYIDALNPDLSQSATDYLNLLLCRRGAKYGWTWRQTREMEHPVLRNERAYNTITVVTGAGQGLMDGYRLPPISLKGRAKLH